MIDKILEGFFLSLGFLPLAIFIVWFSYVLPKWISFDWKWLKEVVPDDEDFDMGEETDRVSAVDKVEIVSLKLVSNETLCQGLGALQSLSEESVEDICIAVDVYMGDELLDHSSTFVSSLKPGEKVGFTLYFNLLEGKTKVECLRLQSRIESAYAKTS